MSEVDRLRRVVRKRRVQHRVLNRRFACTQTNNKSGCTFTDVDTRAPLSGPVANAVSVGGSGECPIESVPGRQVGVRSLHATFFHGAAPAGVRSDLLSHLPHVRGDLLKDGGLRVSRLQARRLSLQRQQFIAAHVTTRRCPPVATLAPFRHQATHTANINYTNSRRDHCTVPVSRATGDNCCACNRCTPRCILRIGDLRALANPRPYPQQRC